MERNSIGVDNDDLTSATIHYNHIHDYSLISAVTEEPTCTENGYIEYTCAYGEKYRVTVSALGHSKGTDVTTVAPTCTERGYDLSSCSRCGVECKTDYVNALGHDFSGEETVVSPTCTEEGYTGTKCIRCAVTEKSNYTDFLGHKMVAVAAKEATCTEPGNTAGTACERCGMLGAASVIPVKGHDYAPATCTAPKTCKVCGTAEGEALGHKFNILKYNEDEHWNECACGTEEFDYRFGHGYSRVSDADNH